MKCLPVCIACFLLACADDVHRDAGLSKCMQVEAAPGAYWTNGPGYCEGDVHVRCSNGEVFSETVCPPGSCIVHGVPRIVFVGCATPNPLCTEPQGIDLYWVCDGKTPIACWGGFAVDADGSEINC